MSKLPNVFLALISFVGATSCQSVRPVVASQPNPMEEATPPADAFTEARARASLARYLQQQPNAAVYQLASATVTDVDTKWQILVPRTDWAQVMPNAAAFEVDKKTAAITVLRVK